MKTEIYISDHPFEYLEIIVMDDDKISVVIIQEIYKNIIGFENCYMISSEQLKEYICEGYIPYNDCGGRQIFLTSKKGECEYVF